MGRRKIEIKAIQDDRNRSVTFLKRKGGLFKKAHELSVLCSVEVAVIIFGNNNKLYEYSSGKMGEILTRYEHYGGANEHKGPADFTRKARDMDKDDDDDESGMSHHGSVERQMMPPQFQNQIASQHVHSTSSASPPISNGEFSHHQPQQRQITPGPHSGPAPRASSRNGLQRTQTSSNLVSQGPHHPPLQNLYAYMPNLEIYDPHNGPNMQGASIEIPPQSSYGQISQYPDCGPPQQYQAQLIHPDKHRKVSMPPAFPKHYYESGNIRIGEGTRNGISIQIGESIGKKKSIP